MKSEANPSARIRTLRETYGMSQEVLAERSAVPLELIKKIEAGIIPDLAPLVKIARTLGVRLGTILDEDRELGPVRTRKGEGGETLRFITPNAQQQENGLKYKVSLLAGGSAHGALYHRSPRKG
jgi:transcriptional regulator with XRE-family HTH domain